MSESEIQEVELPEADDKPLGAPAVTGTLFSAIKDIDISLTAVLGKSSMSVNELVDLKENAVVELDQDSSAPINLTLNGEVVASGSIVVVGDKFGIKITEVIEFQ